MYCAQEDKFKLNVKVVYKHMGRKKLKIITTQKLLCAGEKS